MKSQRQFEYAAYLLTSHWRMLRARVFWRDERKCVRCSSKDRIQAHHRFYRQRFEDSDPDDLITLCRKCHRKEHGLTTKKASSFNRAKEQRKRQRKLRRMQAGWQKMIRSGQWSH